MCKTSAAANKGASGSDGGSSSASTPAPSATPAEKAEAGSGATAGEAGEEPKSFQVGLGLGCGLELVFVLRRNDEVGEVGQGIWS